MAVYDFNLITDKKIVPINSLALTAAGNSYLWEPLEEGSSYSWVNLYQGRTSSNRLVGCRLDIVAFIWQNNYADLIPHLVGIGESGIDTGSLLLKPIDGQQGAGEMTIGVPDENTLVHDWRMQWGVTSAEYWGKMQVTLTAYYSKDVYESPEADVFNQISGWI